MERNEIIKDKIRFFFTVNYRLFGKRPTRTNYIFIIKLIDELRICLPDDEVIKKIFGKETGEFCRNAIAISADDLSADLGADFSEEKDLLETEDRDFVNLLKEAIYFAQALATFDFVGTTLISDHNKNDFIKKLRKIIRESSTLSDNK